MRTVSVPYIYTSELGELFVPLECLDESFGDADVDDYFFSTLWWSTGIQEQAIKTKIPIHMPTATIFTGLPSKITAVHLYSDAFIYLFKFLDLF